MPTVPFQKIAEACRTTGLSQYYLRQGCKDGTIPHIRSGSTYYVNVPELLRQLNADGAAAEGHDTLGSAGRKTCFEHTYSKTTRLTSPSEGDRIT